MVYYVRGNPSDTKNINPKDLAIALLSALPAYDENGNIKSGAYYRTPTTEREKALVTIKRPDGDVNSGYNYAMIQWHLGGWTTVINSPVNDSWYIKSSGD